MNLDVAFSALSDPTRRTIIRALVHRPRRSGELAEYVNMSAPALSRHLRVLRRAGMIIEGGIPHDARVRIYRLAPEAFVSARTWLTEIEEFWTDQLQSFKQHADRTSERTSRKGRDS